MDDEAQPEIEATFVLSEPWGIGLRFEDPTNTYNVPGDIRDGRPVQAVIAGVEPGSQAALYHPQLTTGLVLRRVAGTAVDGLSFHAIDALMMAASKTRPTIFMFTKHASPPSRQDLVLPEADAPPRAAPGELESFAAMAGLDLDTAKLAVAQAGGSVELAADMFFQSLDDSGGGGDDADSISESLPPGSFNIGDRVTIKPDVAEVQQLQTEEHGGWEVDMHEYCGQTGEIFQVFPDGDCKVLFATGRRLCWNPAAFVVEGAEPEPEPEPEVEAQPETEPEPQPEPEPEPEPLDPLVLEYIRDGISYAGLRHVIALFDRLPPDATTSDLCQEHLKARTVPAGWVDIPQLILRDDQGNDVSKNRWYKHSYRQVDSDATQSTPPAGTQSFCQLLKGDPATAGFVGKPTAFLSHAWVYRFHNLVDAVEAYVEALPDDAEEHFFWFDCFSLDQHAQASQGSQWWSTTFMQAIGAIGNTVMVLSPWDAPIPLTRAWCVWELFCTATTSAEFAVCLGKDEEAAFNAALLSLDDVSFLDAFSKISVGTAQAGSETDRLMIINAAAAAPGGLTALDGVAIGPLRQWIIGRIRLLLQTNADGSLVASDESLRTASSVAMALHTVGGEDRDALAIQAKVVEARTAMLGMNDPATLHAMTSQASSLNSLGRLREARKLYETVLFAENTSTAVANVQRRARTNIIGLLRQMGDINEALRLSQLHCADLEELRGPNSLETLMAQNNFAGLLGEVGGLRAIAEARRLMTLVVAGRTEQLGQRHTETLSAQMNLALLLKVFGTNSSIGDGTELAEAERLLELVVDGKLAQLGPRHSSTLAAQMNQAGVLRAMRKNREAAAVFAAVAEHSEPHHPWYADAIEQAQDDGTRTFTLG